MKKISLLLTIGMSFSTIVPMQQNVVDLIVNLKESNVLVRTSDQNDAELKKAEEIMLFERDASSGMSQCAIKFQDGSNDYVFRTVEEPIATLINRLYNKYNKDSKQQWHMQTRNPAFSTITYDENENVFHDEEDDLSECSKPSLAKIS